MYIAGIKETMIFSFQSVFVICILSAHEFQLQFK